MVAIVNVDRIYHRFSELLTFKHDEDTTIIHKYLMPSLSFVYKDPSETDNVVTVEVTQNVMVADLTMANLAYGLLTTVARTDTPCTSLQLKAIAIQFKIGGIELTYEYTGVCDGAGN